MSAQNKHAQQSSTTFFLLLFSFLNVSLLHDLFHNKRIYELCCVYRERCSSRPKTQYCFRVKAKGTS